MHTIEQRKLGKSGLAVPALGIGIWSWGETGWWNYGQSHTHDDVIQAYRTCLDAGFTFFDTAGVYGNGASERPLGASPGVCRRSTPVCIAISASLSRNQWRAGCLSRTECRADCLQSSGAGHPDW